MKSDDECCSDWADYVSTVRATEAEDSTLMVDGLASEVGSTASAEPFGLSSDGSLPTAAIAAAQERRTALMRDAALAPLVRRGEEVAEAIAELNVHHPPSLKPGLVWCVRSVACCACCMRCDTNMIPAESQSGPAVVCVPYAVFARRAVCAVRHR